MNERGALAAKRCYSLDAVKFLAAVLIVFHHYQQTTGLRFARLNFFEGPVYFGYLVELFFLLSGFFTAQGMERDRQTTLGGFMLHRYIRLAPMTALAVLCVTLAAWVWRIAAGDWWNGQSIGIWQAAENALLLEASVIGPTWYLCVLVRCCLLYKLFLCLAQRLGVTPFYFFALPVCLLGREALGVTANMSRGLVAFFWGIFLYCIYRRVADLPALKPALIVVLAVCAFPAFFGIEGMYGTQNLVLVFFAYPALVLLMLTSSLLRKVFDHRFWGVLGAASFEMYLWHVPLLYLGGLAAGALGLNMRHSATSMLLFTAFVIAFSMALYLGVERPLLRRLRVRLESGEESTAGVAV